MIGALTRGDATLVMNGMRNFTDKMTRVLSGIPQIQRRRPQAEPLPTESDAEIAGIEAAEAAERARGEEEVAATGFTTSTDEIKSRVTELAKAGDPQVRALGGYNFVLQLLKKLQLI